MPDSLALLMEQAWPGNVRQLRHEIERIFVFCEGGRLTTEDIQPGSTAKRSASQRNRESPEPDSTPGNLNCGQGAGVGSKVNVVGETVVPANSLAPHATHPARMACPLLISMDDRQRSRQHHIVGLGAIVEHDGGTTEQGTGQ